MVLSKSRSSLFVHQNYLWSFFKPCMLRPHYLPHGLWLRTDWHPGTHVCVELHSQEMLPTLYTPTPRTNGKRATCLRVLWKCSGLSTKLPGVCSGATPRALQHAFLHSAVTLTSSRWRYCKLKVGESGSIFKGHYQAALECRRQWEISPNTL